MRSTLKQFTCQNLKDASGAFLKKMGLEYAPQFRHGDFDNFFEVNDFSYRYLTEAKNCVEHIWEIGAIDNETLQGNLESSNDRYLFMEVLACQIKPDAKFSRHIAVALTRAFNRVFSHSFNHQIEDIPTIVLMLQGNSLSIATCKRTDRLDDKGEKIGQVTMLRNINCRKPHKGHIKILERIAADVCGCKTYAEIYTKWLNSFSIKIIDDDFFDRYKEIYEDIVEFATGKRWVQDGDSWVERDNHNPCPRIMKEFAGFPDPDKAVRDYVKKLLGRIVFLYFLQKKGWMGVKKGESWKGGDEDFLLHLYDRSNMKESFIDDVLVPLFRDINTNREASGYLVTNPNVGKDIKVPYLNGGLFEEDELDKVQFPLGEDSKGKGLIDEMINFFAEYYFTVDENTPDDVEIGVDPEMLGRIFENLLEDNKDKGAFYTPKEIVQYMSQEALIAHLVRKTSLDESFLRSFVQEPDMYVNKFDEDQKYSILDAILNVKICDPAIGSGAFPIGLLNELVRCKEAIYGDKKGRAEIKKEIIRDNIYGVDIEKGAVDIARLRFWLSLIVDEDEPLPLPNLDYKIMQGNSLLERYDGVDLSKLTVHNGYDDMFGGGQAESLKTNLSQLLKEYYNTSNHSKKTDLKDKIKKTISEILGIAGVEIPQGIDLAENSQFFLWHTWYNEVFLENQGFDIVIGNPPYIRHEKLAHQYKQLLCSLYPDVGYSTADILVYFFGLGLNILAPNGTLIYITSNKFFKTRYGLNIRKHFAKSVDVDLIIDFFELPIFNASTDAAITKLYKRDPACSTKYYPILTLENLNLMKRVVEDYQVVIKDDTEWKFIDHNEFSILQKFSEGAISLAEFVNERIYSGIKTGANNSFILSTDTRNQILSNCKSEEERERTNSIIKRAFKSRYIRKYNYAGPETWLLFIPWHFPIPFEDAEQMPPARAIAIAEERLVQEYPAVYHYLLSHREELVARNASETGIRYEWYALQRWGANYYREFDEAKLIYIHTAVNHEFYFDVDKHYVNNSCYIIVSKSKFLYAFLNSSLFRYYKKIKFVAYGNGAVDGRCKLDGNKMRTIPIKASADEQVFSSIVDKMISLKNEDPDTDVSGLEKQIDSKLYDLYGFTEEEISIIEGTALNDDTDDQCLDDDTLV